MLYRLLPGVAKYTIYGNIFFSSGWQFCKVTHHNMGCGTCMEDIIGLYYLQPTEYNPEPCTVIDKYRQMYFFFNLCCFKSYSQT